MLRYLIICIISAYCIASYAGSKVPNNNFEKVDKKGFIVGWGQYKPKRPRVKPVSSDFNGGRYSLCVVPKDVIINIDKIDIEPGKAYTLSFYAKSSGGNKYYVRCTIQTLIPNRIIIRKKYFI